MATVLVVHDGELMRTLWARQLRNAGLRVHEAEDGMVAWELLMAHSFDAVVTNLRMPRMDGQALLRRIRDWEHGRDLPVLVSSAMPGDAWRAELLRAGANECVAATRLGPAALVGWVRSVTSSRR